jgi:hypothetical protein
MREYGVTAFLAMLRLGAAESNEDLAELFTVCGLFLLAGLFIAAAFTYALNSAKLAFLISERYLDLWKELGCPAVNRTGIRGHDLQMSPALPMIAWLLRGNPGPVEGDGECMRLFTRARWALIACGVGMLVASVGITVAEW